MHLIGRCRYVKNISLNVANLWIQELNHMPVTYQIFSWYILITYTDKQILNNLKLILRQYMAVTIETICDKTFS